MTVAEFIEWLKTQPQAATVEVLEYDSEHGCHRFVNFDQSLHSDLYIADAVTQSQVLELGSR